MDLARLLTCLLIWTAAWLSAPPAVHAQEDQAPSRPDHVSAELWAELQRVDERVEAVQSLRGRFERHRHTPLLRRPMVSEGVVYVQGERVRWETEAPSPSTTLVRDGEVWIYQPEARRVEVYALEDRAELLGGPTPRLTALPETFDLARAEPDELFDDLDEDVDDGADAAAGALALRLTPRDEALAEEVTSMAMLLDRASGQLRRLRIDTGEGQWTEYRFLEVETDVELPEGTFELHLPRNVEWVRPMEGGD